MQCTDLASGPHGSAVRRAEGRTCTAALVPLYFYVCPTVDTVVERTVLYGITVVQENGPDADVDELFHGELLLDVILVFGVIDVD